ncbi:DUF4876 domain-containing protein [bacterium]|nr:DUF4876 domain-containing protein [bacterium]MBU1065980.1 DUF4876 domain-containing protein [bacterium]MBU1633030.1 DUF4876 domain-containing protein [bacterium]MBU1873084.1 DUF4876 domain-containing protein [bacterium]
MVKKLLFLLFIPILFLPGCFKGKPTQFDGELSVKLYVVFEGNYLPNIPVLLSTFDYNISSYIDTTDSAGLAEFEPVPYAEYKVNTKATIMVPSFDNPDSLVEINVVGAGIVAPGDGNIIIDTLEVIASGAEPGLKINEIYTVGPPNNSYYWFDQFIELYNSSEDTIYLDGMVVCRMGEFLADVTYIFQFPGEPLTGREYAVPPNSFVVLAQDAMDHTNIPNFPLPGSVDLSHADWEFRNSMDYGDFDNPDVPNIDNIETGHRLDFMISLINDIILIADGSDLNYLDGIDINSVIDCVEYHTSSDAMKYIEAELDRGYAGIGLIRYSGRSMERISAGFDSNNSTVDFEIINHPTPGYQHE